MRYWVDPTEPLPVPVLLAPTFELEPVAPALLDPTDPEPTELDPAETPEPVEPTALLVAPVPEPPSTPLAPVADPTAAFELPVLPTSIVPTVLDPVEAIPALDPFAVSPMVEDELLLLPLDELSLDELLPPL